MPRSICFLIAAALSSHGAIAAECVVSSPDRRTPVVELFTSEGCNSCPPADRWLSSLDARIGAEPLSILAYHVDYWDYIGWKDRFADPAHGDRHRNRVHAAGGSIRYTPQVFVDGREYLEWRHGNRPTSTGQAPIRLQARVAPPAADLTVALEVTGQSTQGEPSMLTIALIENALSSEVRAGENAGRLLRHDHVVRAASEHPLDGANFHQKATLDISATARPENSAIVIVVRDRGMHTMQSMTIPLCHV